MLIVLELANNHCKSIEHGKLIMDSFYKVKEKFKEYEFAFKFQYRDLPNFIHPDFRDRQDIKYVKRFMDTILTEEEFLELKNHATSLGFKTICTPFDEVSAKRVKDHGYDYLKIGSCSANDWPLLEVVAELGMKVILSTGGLPAAELNNVVSFLEGRGIEVSILHCVGEYPTKPENFQLNQIDYLRNNFPNRRVGLSTHEESDCVFSASIAASKGISIIEKHVDVETAYHHMNAYSVEPLDLTLWLEEYKEALKMCGSRADLRPEFPEEELKTLHSLRRGVYLNKTLTGKTITKDDIFLAIPAVEGQLTANDLSKYKEFGVPIGKVIKKNEPLFMKDIDFFDKKQHTLSIVRKIKNIIDKSGITLPPESKLELSHHYGLTDFENHGCAIITVLNGPLYCKKYIIVLPGQEHPEHYHMKKDETFIVLYGMCSFEIDGYHFGDEFAGRILPVKPMEKHSFNCDNKVGAIFEEISTTHFNDDSYYTDLTILENKNRKTTINNWQGII